MADKLTIRTNLVGKEEQFEPKNCVVEKVIPLYEGSFQDLMKDPFNDYSYIKGYTDLMREDEDGVHCILFISKESGDGILVEADDSGHVIYAQFVSRAEDILLAQSFTETEKKYHDFYSKYINNAINNGSETAKINLVDLTSDSSHSVMFGDCIDELIYQNPAVESTECDSEDIIIKKKELITHKLYCPLKIQVCDEESDYEYEDVSSSDLIGYEYEINDDIENSFGQIGANESERERGLMAYTWYPRLDALVYSAFPKVEERGGRMYGVLEYQSYGELPAADLIDFIGEMTGQFSDGWGEGYEQDAVELDGKEYYISFWNSDHYYLKPEEEVFPQHNVEMKM